MRKRIAQKKNIFISNIIISHFVCVLCIIKSRYYIQRSFLWLTHEDETNRLRTEWKYRWRERKFKWLKEITHPRSTFGNEKKKKTVGFGWVKQMSTLFSSVCLVCAFTICQFQSIRRTEYFACRFVTDLNRIFIQCITLVAKIFAYIGASLMGEGAVA